MKLTALQEKWLQELESGQHGQTSKTLCDTSGYCCLGVAEKFVFERDLRDDGCIYSQNNPNGFTNAVMLDEDTILLGLYSQNGIIFEEFSKTFYQSLQDAGYKGLQRCTLAGYNDDKATFKQLAEAIRKHPEAVFK